MLDHTVSFDLPLKKKKEEKKNIYQKCGDKFFKVLSYYKHSRTGLYIIAR